MDGNGSDGVCEGAEVATCRRELLFDSIRRIGYLLLFLIYDKIGKNTKVFKKQKYFPLLIMFHIIYRRNTLLYRRNPFHFKESNKRNNPFRKTF